MLFNVKLYSFLYSFLFLMSVFFYLFISQRPCGSCFFTSFGVPLPNQPTECKNEKKIKYFSFDKEISKG